MKSVSLRNLLFILMTLLWYGHGWQADSPCVIPTATLVWRKNKQNFRRNTSSPWRWKDEVRGNVLDFSSKRPHPTCQGSSPLASPKGGHLICTPLAPSSPETWHSLPCLLPEMLLTLSLWTTLAWHPSTSQATPSWCLSLDPPSSTSLSLELPAALPLACFSFLSALTHMALNTSFILTTHPFAAPTQISSSLLHVSTWRPLSLLWMINNNMESLMSKDLEWIQEAIRDVKLASTLDTTESFDSAFLSPLELLLFRNHSLATSLLPSDWCLPQS